MRKTLASFQKPQVPGHNLPETISTIIACVYIYSKHTINSKHKAHAHDHDHDHALDVISNVMPDLIRGPCRKRTMFLSFRAVYHSTELNHSERHHVLSRSMDAGIKSDMTAEGEDEGKAL